MRDMEFFDMQHVVESFIEKNRAVISALSIQHRALPPRPIPCTTGLPTSNHNISPPQVAPPQPCTHDPCMRPENPTPAPAAEEDGENPYTTFFPAPQRSRHNSADTEYEDQDHSAKSTSSSNEDEIYWEPYQHCILKSTSLGPYPLHRERMKLLVKPFQDIIHEGMERRITTEIQCSIPKAKFDLEITSGHTIHDRYLSAKLFLYPGSQLEKEVEDGLYYIHTELQIRQKLKKQKNHQSLYTHSALLDLPQAASSCHPQAAESPVASSLHSQAAEPPVTSSFHPQAAEPPVTSSSPASRSPTFPDSLPSLQLQTDQQQQPHSLETQWSGQHSLSSSDLPPPIQESQSPSSLFPRSSSDTSLSPDYSRMKLDLSSSSSRVPVASFPAIISHKNFLNRKLISRPYLTLVFTLTQYRQ